MGISRYLAMTAAEMEAFSVPEGWAAAYMACHFSPYSTGLSNIPSKLPSGSMLILNDRMPISGHAPDRIAQQLLQAMEKLSFSCVLLDFQRPSQEETACLCRHLAQSLSCPVGVSDSYAQDLTCPVFLSPPPLDQPLPEYIAPWQDREIWLDTAPEAAQFIVTETGSQCASLSFPVTEENFFTDDALHCHYRTEIREDAVHFHLWRDLPQIEALLQEAQSLGVTKCIGLYQQLCTVK